MATIQITYQTNTTLEPLTLYNRIGRHPDCDIVIPCIELPLFWVDIAWRENLWYWRAIHQVAHRTWCRNMVIRDGWSRLFVSRTFLRRPLCFNGQAIVELINQKPPSHIKFQ